MANTKERSGELARIAIAALEEKKAADIRVIDISEVSVLADYIEPGRDSAPNLPRVRSLAFDSIDDCVLQILKDTLSYLGPTGADVDPMTQITYEYYRRCDEERKFYE